MQSSSREKKGLEKKTEAERSVKRTFRLFNRR
jgi:hypothetical protein